MNLAHIHPRQILRRQLIAELLDTHLSFDAVRATADWDELTCLEQMELDELEDMGVL